MENASKALIIAGAILISILLIAVSMYVYNAAKQPLESAASQMSSQDVQAYNADFEPYIGKKIRGSQVRALIDVVINKNNANIDQSGKFTAIQYGEDENGAKKTYGTPGDEKNDSQKVSEAAAAMSEIKGKINTGTTYTIKASYSANGLITTISF